MRRKKNVKKRNTDRVLTDTYILEIKKVAKPLFLFQIGKLSAQFEMVYKV
jgi:hypothetical protein